MSSATECELRKSSILEPPAEAAVALALRSLDSLTSIVSSASMLLASSEGTAVPVSMSSLSPSGLSLILEESLPDRRSSEVIGSRREPVDFRPASRGFAARDARYVSTSPSVMSLWTVSTCRWTASTERKDLPHRTHWVAARIKWYCECSCSFSIVLKAREHWLHRYLYTWRSEMGTGTPPLSLRNLAACCSTLRLESMRRSLLESPESDLVSPLSRESSSMKPFFEPEEPIVTSVCSTSCIRRGIPSFVTLCTSVRWDSRSDRSSNAS